MEISIRLSNLERCWLKHWINYRRTTRLIFEKNRFEGKKYTEIAEEQQISVKTVEAHISKALKILRVELKDYLPFLILLFQTPDKYINIGNLPFMRLITNT